MKRLLLAVSLALLVGSGYALAAGTTITLTDAGPQPPQVTVGWGDTVTFANSDSKPHQVAIPRVSLESPPIAPGGTFEHVFDGRAGNYGFRQIGGGRNRGGTILVDLKGTVTLVARPGTVAWGKTLRLSGRSAYPGTPVNLVLYRASEGGEWRQVATTTAAGDGSFSFALKGERGARYRALAAADQLRSQQVVVLVKPAVAVQARPRRTKAGGRVTLTARIAPAQAATALDLERYDAERRRWTSELRRPLAGGRARFRWKALKGKTRLRVVVMRRSVNEGWVGSASAPVTITGV